MSRNILSRAALFIGLGLVGLSYAWPKLRTDNSSENQEVLAKAAAHVHESLNPRAGDPNETPQVRAARIEEIKQNYQVQRDNLVQAKAAVARTANVFYFSGIAIGTSGLIGLVVAKQPKS